MELGHLIAFNVALLAAMASPGPALLLALRISITSGTLSGMSAGAGLALMASLWTLAALLGLDVVFALFPWAFALLKTLGAIYLLYIAWGMWRDASKPLSVSQAPVQQAFRSGFMVNLGNPKSVLFASAVLLVIFPSDMSVSENLAIWLNHLLVEFVVYSGFAYLLSTRPARDGYLKAKPLLDRLAAGIMGVLGLRLLISR